MAPLSVPPGSIPIHYSHATNGGSTPHSELDAEIVEIARPNFEAIKAYTLALTMGTFGTFTGGVIFSAANPSASSSELLFVETLIISAFALLALCGFQMSSTAKSDEEMWCNAERTLRTGEMV